MNTMNNYIHDEEIATPMISDSLILVNEVCYNCTKCSFSIEIISINDKENILTFKCLNPIEKENHNTQTISISEYINSMKKYTYLFSECYICNKLQNQSKNIPIFSYCIKCDKIICDNCINKHLELNEKNHKNMSKKFIIKNNEKGIKCLLHPTERNIAFCFDCNTHLCHKCLKSRKHIMHKKNDLIEVKPSEEMIETLNGIINIYKEKIKNLNKEKEKKELELYNKLKEDNKKVKEDNENKIKEIKKELIKEKIKNEKILNDDLNILKKNYENEIKLRKNEYSIIIDNLNKKYKKLEEFYYFKTNEELEKNKKEYNETLNSLEYNKKIKENENLLLFNNIIKNTQEIYEDNYYNNCNINNIIYSYYKSEDPFIKNLLKDNSEIYNQLNNKEEEERKYKIKNTEIEKLKSENSENIKIINNFKNKIEKLNNKITSEKYICKIKTDKYIGYGFLFNIPNPVLIIPDNKLPKDDIEIGKEITILLNNDKIIKKIKINVNRNISIIDKLDDKEVNIIIIELNKNEEEVEKQTFFDLELFGNAINEYFNNKIIMTLNVKNEDINKNIYFLDNTDNIYNENGKNVKHHHDNLQELNENNTKLFINNEHVIFKKYFIPKKIGIYKIQLEFKTQLKNCSYMFCGCENITEINLSFFNTQNVTDMKYMFYQCSSLTILNLSSFNTENVTNMQYIFCYCSSLKSLDLKFFKTEKVINMENMFYLCKSLITLNLQSFNTQNVTNMSGMFRGCSSLITLDLKSFNTEKVTSMYFMFNCCSSLITLDLKSFNTQNVTNMGNMFYSCKSLISLDLKTFNTMKVNNMGWMFDHCSSLTTINLSSFNTDKVNDMQFMFFECCSLTSINLSTFNTKNVTTMQGMFYGCSSLNILDLYLFKGDKANTKNMFYGCKNLLNCGSSDKNILDAFSSKNIKK